MLRCTGSYKLTKGIVKEFHKVWIIKKIRIGFSIEQLILFCLCMCLLFFFLNFNYSVLMGKYWGQHSSMSNTFSIPMLNRSYFFHSAITIKNLGIGVCTIKLKLKINKSNVIFTDIFLEGYFQYVW